MTRKGLNRLLLYLCLLVTQFQFVAGGETTSGSVDIKNGKKELEEELGWSWERILTSRETIVANGNVWPPSKNETSNDCLILVTRNQYIWHCPSYNGSSLQNKVLYNGDPGRYRGAFMAPGTENRRLWLLNSPSDHDVLLEFDTMTGEILQELEIEGTVDGHDAVRVGDKVFIVDTRHGHVVEIAIPASKPPYTESSIEAGAKLTEYEEYVDIIKRHTGFTRADHINNVAIHDKLLISNLHGRSAKKSGNSLSPTRLSALQRSIPEEEGRELSPISDGFHPVENVGSMCHGIAFWEDKVDKTTIAANKESGNNDEQEATASQIKLISLDSKEGTLVSVVLAGPKKGQREVLWVPDETHPVLIPPDGIASRYKNGAKIFSKGLAVQGGVAYFGVSYARAPQLRQMVPESLLVAFNLTTKKELWARTIKSNGLINQILTQSYLGGPIQLPQKKMNTMELTYHDHPTTEENIVATVNFKPNTQCFKKDGTKKGIPLMMKDFKDPYKKITDIDDHLEYIVQHICNLNVEPLQERVLQLGDEGFKNEYQIDNGNAVLAPVIPLKKSHVKLNNERITFIFSNKGGDKIYHFPWLYTWLPMLQELILNPLGIPLNQILRMQLASMPKGSDIKWHSDRNNWVKRAHRVHIPIVTHSEVFFLTKVKNAKLQDPTLRIKSNVGEAYEFNNALMHRVRNDGSTRVHLIVDWMESTTYSKGNDDDLITLKPRTICESVKRQNGLSCTVQNVEDEL